MNLFDIKGKVALVTGSTHGLGMSMAHGLGLAGATIVVNGNSSQQKVDDAVAHYKAAGINAVGTSLMCLMKQLLSWLFKK